MRLMNDEHINREVVSGEFRKEIRRIIDFWTCNVVDTRTPGFHGQIEEDGTVNDKANKGAILCSRTLWFLSEAARHTGERKTAMAADHMYKYANTFFKDETGEGFYWSLHPDSSVANDRKQTFAHALFIYAFCAYYRLRQNNDILEKAKNLWMLLENKTSFMEIGCHVAAFNKNWVPLKNMRLDDNDIDAPHTFDTELHVLEAYTALYRIEPHPDLENSIRLCLKAFAEYFIDSKTWILHTHLDRYGKSVSRVVLYGHNVECAWLIWDAVDALNDEALIDYWQPIVLSLIKKVITDGVDDSGKLLEGYVKISGLPMTASVWWVQTEALNAFLLAEELDPGKKYLEYFISLWNHVKTKHIDERHGEWLSYSKDDIAKGMNSSLVNEWKGPYHNGRAMLKAFTYFSKRKEEGENTLL
jgi:cellobiose epimerase